ncbi:hypothetical protein M441DRAFT_430364 [Trichoderma asperellum CBS 433.97]|uniref:Uncharacterized protein n=1 Tax=Trichoderma asperellum (strain ATCC 204424 / CBS 433.97 / NBRC 101777) TaxID=1042311 RepID=A0A2T3Z699_TRIA4|nr:hypothetical protein M441DRAFT_430364 [Trichoderma asperellum CBS 433.97]PTB40280.1 hypothetical protein M441DRAFT_430364 [Trichoderma asperellum CBS 433.97]
MRLYGAALYVPVYTVCLYVCSTRVCMYVCICRAELRRIASGQALDSTVSSVGRSRVDMATARSW